jgi:hypothetical protein
LRAWITLLERIAAKLAPADAAGFFDDKSFALALKELLREATFSDDPALGARVIGLQVRLLQLGLRGMEQMLEEAVERVSPWSRR